ncbi:MAG: metallophosphoesterase, partial [Gammaproteobacteria bacterium]
MQNWNGEKLLIDPRAGDIHDDVASPRNSLLAMAGGLLVEINLVKLALAVLIMIFLPAVLLGLAPLLATGWLNVLPRGIADLVPEIVPVISLVVALVAAWFGGRPLFRATERSFWSLSSIVVQPGYAMFREGLRHLGESVLPEEVSPQARARLSAVSTAVAGILLCGLALWAVYLVWPSTRWIGNLADMRFPQRLIVPTLANSVVIVGAFLAGASLFWSIADATMDQPRDLPDFDPEPSAGTVWRVAQLSDLHTVGGQYEFRLESGRAGPQGNDRVVESLARLAAAHAQDPVDLVVLSGDVSDGGRLTEWAAFLDALGEYPELASRTLMLPGNHDLNVVDRSNPARLELPTGTGKAVREMRMLSALVAVQGDRVLVMDRATRQFSAKLADAIAPHEDDIRRFADTGNFRLSLKLAHLWEDLFPMILPPQKPGGLGVILLNSNAETHFSFTSALGLVSTAQTRDLIAATRQFPEARWIIGLHHHLMEYPKAGSTLAARIGTALINGSWFVRQLRPLGQKVVAMHGHRHVDWFGICGETRMISAPSP